MSKIEKKINQTNTHNVFEDAMILQSEKKTQKTLITCLVN